MENEKKMSFIEHLEELRTRIIKCLITVSIFSCISYLFIKQILGFLIKPMGPMGKVVFINPLEAFSSYIGLALFTGVFVSSPIIIFQIWRFVSCGLLKKERKYLLIYIPISFFLFVSGVVFAFFVIFPICLQFLLGFGTDFLQPMITVSRYISFAGVFLLSFGVVFQLPLVILFLTQMGWVSTTTLRRNRKYAILLIFIVAAVITPTPDAFSQILMAVPLLFLLEMSIWLAVLLERRRLKREKRSCSTLTT